RWPPPLPRPSLRRLRRRCLLRHRVGGALFDRSPNDGSSLGRAPRCPEPDVALVIEPDQMPPVALRDDCDLLEAIHGHPPTYSADCGGRIAQQETGRAVLLGCRSAGISLVALDSEGRTASGTTLHQREGHRDYFFDGSHPRSPSASVLGERRVRAG